MYTCSDPESFATGGPTLTIYLVDEGRKDPNTTISGPLLARQGKAIKWRFTAVLMLAGLVALVFSGDPDQYCLETLYFCDFSGLPPPPPPPPP